jgi:hypothetical protein
MPQSGKVGTITGLDSLTKNEMAKLGIKGANLIGKEVLNGFIAYQEAMSALNGTLDTMNYQKKMEWFGAGSLIEVNEGTVAELDGVPAISFAGIHNPDTIRNIYVWQSEGMMGWDDADRDELNTIMTKIKESGKYADNVISDAEKLIYGGYDILGEADMGRFITAIQAINRESKIVAVGDNNWGYFRNE